MLAYVYDYSIVNWTLNTLVYSVPGTLPPSGVTAEGEASLRKPFPNPAGTAVTIPYTLPQGSDAAEIRLLNSSGQVVRTYRVDRTFSDLIIQRGELPGGVYVYQISSRDGVLDSGKIILK